jgi:transposase-like protein
MEHELTKSLFDAIRYFSDPDVCVDFVASMRWPDGPTCPHCDSQNVSYLSTRRIWKCMAKECHKQFSVKTGTIFEDSPIPLDKWLTAVWLIVNCKNGVSSYEIARDLKVTQKSAWFMLHRIRFALESGHWEKMGGSDCGPVESDETFVGPNPRKMHADKREARTRASVLVLACRFSAYWIVSFAKSAPRGAERCGGAGIPVQQPRNEGKSAGRQGAFCAGSIADFREETDLC